MIEKIILLGAGNVATHLGMAFQRAGYSVLQVYSRESFSAESLAGKLGCASAGRMESISQEADLYVIAVTDDAIASVAARFPHKDKLLVHTSGTSPMDVLKAGSNRIGVLYPLQTFTKEVAVDFSTVPICLESYRSADDDRLEAFARSLSKTVVWIPSDQRRILHVAAVFACNFVNHMYAMAAGILEENELGFELLRPLIGETARKVMEGDPREMQTGPARRNNKSILEEHRKMLSANPDYCKIYTFISESIRKTYNP